MDSLELEFQMMFNDTDGFECIEPDSPFEMDEFDESEPNYDAFNDNDEIPIATSLNFTKKDVKKTEQKTEEVVKSESDEMFEKMGVPSYKEKKEGNKSSSVQTVKAQETKTNKEDNKANIKKDKENIAKKDTEVKSEGKANHTNNDKAKEVNMPNQAPTFTEVKEVNKTEDSVKPNKEEEPKVSVTLEAKKEDTQSLNSSNTNKAPRFDYSYDEDINFSFNESDYYDINEPTDEFEYISDTEYNTRKVYTEEDIKIIKSIDEDFRKQQEAKASGKTITIPPIVIDTIIKFKKPLAMVAMFLFILGIPLIFSKGGFNNSNTNTTHAKEYAYSANTEVYEEAQKATVNKSNEDKSGRFATLDELTLYIESNTGSILSEEIQLVNSYNAGSISKQVYINSMNDCISRANSINHLLLINKDVYENEKEMKKYEEMAGNLETLFIYGDTALVNMK